MNIVYKIASSIINRIEESKQKRFTEAFKIQKRTFNECYRNPHLAECNNECVYYHCIASGGECPVARDNENAYNITKKDNFRILNAFGSKSRRIINKNGKIKYTIDMEQ